MTRRARAGGLAVVALAAAVLAVLCWLLIRMAIVVDTLPPVVGLGTDPEHGWLETAAVVLGWSLLGLGALTGAVLLLIERSGASASGLEQR